MAPRIAQSDFDRVWWRPQRRPDAAPRRRGSTHLASTATADGTPATPAELWSARSRYPPRWTSRSSSCRSRLTASTSTSSIDGSRR